MKKLALAILIVLLTAVQAWSLTIVRLGPEYFPESDRSRALANGYIYVGEPDTDPSVPVNQKTLSVQQENGIIVTVVQPIRTNAGGVPVYNGSPVTLLVDGNYSLLVQNSLAAQEYYVPSIDGGPVSGNLSDYGCNFETMVASVGTSSDTHIIVDCTPDALTADIVVPSNITVEWRKGATLSGPHNIIFQAEILAGDYLLFENDVTVSLGLMGNVRPAWFGFSESSTASDNTASFNRSISASSPGQKIVVPPGTYDVIDTISVGESCTITGYGVTLDWPITTDIDQGIVISSDNVSIHGFTLDGPQIAVNVPTQKGILATGVDNDPLAPDNIENIIIRDVKANNWWYGINFTFVVGFEASGNVISDCRRGGIIALSSLNGYISGNRIDTITDVAPVYGIQATRNSAGDFIRRPLPENIVITGNKVSNVGLWVGIDTHGGKKITVSDNNIVDCYIGVGLANFNNGVNYAGPKDCKAIGNNIENVNIAATDVGEGLLISGSAVDFGSGNVVSNNTIRGHGNSNATFDQAIAPGILWQWQNNSVLSDNSVINSGKVGISIKSPGVNCLISDNVIKGITGTSGTAYYFDTNAAGGGIGDYFIKGGSVDVPGQTVFYWEEASPARLGKIDIRDYTTMYDQTGGTLAAQYINEIQSIITETQSWDPPSIASGSSASTTIANIPGVSSESSATISVQRDLQGLVMSWETDDVNTNVGDLNVYLYNNTSGAIDIGSLNLRYEMSKRRP